MNPISLVTLRAPKTLGISLPSPVEKELFKAPDAEVTGVRHKADGSSIADSGTALPNGYVSAKKLAILMGFLSHVSTATLVKPARGGAKIQLRPGGEEPKEGAVKVPELAEAFANMDPDRKIGVGGWLNPDGKGGKTINLIVYPEPSAYPPEIRMDLETRAVSLETKLAGGIEVSIK